MMVGLQTAEVPKVLLIAAAPVVAATAGATWAVLAPPGRKLRSAIQHFAACLVFAVALLYLVSEELLTEAHETADTPPLTATFFAGFLVILLLSFNT